MSLIPFRPLPDIGEALSWETDVRRSYDDETRNRLRNHRQSFSQTWNLRGDDFEVFRALMRSNALGEWDLPIWKDARTVTVSAADTTVSCDTNADFWAGSRAILFLTCETYVIVNVTAVGTDAVTLGGAIGVDWTGTFMPLRTAINISGFSTKKIWIRNSQMWSVTTDFLVTEDVDQREYTVDPGGDNPRFVFTFEDSTRSKGTTQKSETARQVKLALDQIEADFGADCDILVRRWGANNPVTATNDGAEQVIEYSPSAADYDTLRTFCDGALPNPQRDRGADYREALRQFDDITPFDSVKRFLEGVPQTNFGPQIIFMIVAGDPFDVNFGADTVATIADGAATLMTAIAGRSAYVYGIDYATTTYTAPLDNTSGVESVATGTDELFNSMSAVISGLTFIEEVTTPDGYPTYLDDPYVKCAGLVIEPAEGRIVQAATVVDSGLGPIVQEQIFEDLDETWAVEYRHTDKADRYKVRRLLHYLSGRERPFWVPELPLRIVSSTVDSIVITPLLPETDDYIGQHIEIDGRFRAVANAATDAGGHRLDFDAISEAPANGWLIRHVRQDVDNIQIEHIGGFVEKVRTVVRNVVS